MIRTKLPIPPEVRHDTLSRTFELSRGHAGHRVRIDTALQHVRDDPLVSSAALDAATALGAVAHRPKLGRSMKKEDSRVTLVLPDMAASIPHLRGPGGCLNA